MSGAQRGTGPDHSKGFGPFRSGLPTTFALRTGLAAAALAGALALLIATFTTVIQIKVGTSTQLASGSTAASGWDRHGPALALLALLGLGLLAPASRGTRAAMTGLAAAGLTAIVIALAWDLPAVHDTGAIGDLYTEATAGPGAGYYLETLGGALLLLSGGGLLVLGGGRATAEPAPGSRDDSPAPSAGQPSLDA